jgi:hypothetical protein
MQREAVAQITDPLVIGVDVARFGDDKTVIRFRKGRDARTHPPIKLRNQDNLQVATRVAQLARDMQADAVIRRWWRQRRRRDRHPAGTCTCPT